MFPTVRWDFRSAGKKLYLTFDDGPTPGVTEEVLNILDRYKAKATFFCLGRNAERHPEIYQLIQERGHSVGNHTYSHLKGWKTSSELYYKDIELAAQNIKSGLFRPPYGQIKPSQAKYLSGKYKIILWEVMSHDYEWRVSEKKSLQSVLKYSREGSIIVFHDSVKAWPKLQTILPRVIEHFSEKGFKFDAIV
ncbi:MAG: polysaccharide deacetylase family protein [Bacteroidales bacterium]|nr:polysaccharide deacetylase family protein [Bacteroidales bacterium]